MELPSVAYISTGTDVTPVLMGASNGRRRWPGSPVAGAAKVEDGNRRCVETDRSGRYQHLTCRQCCFCTLAGEINKWGKFFIF